MSRTRHLVSIHRRVPATGREEYHRAWELVEQRVTAGGAHAWRFVCMGDPDLFIEFLEFAPDRDPRGHADAADAIRDLEAIAPGQAEEWSSL